MLERIATVVIDVSNTRKIESWLLKIEYKTRNVAAPAASRTNTNSEMDLHTDSREVNGHTAKAEE